MSVFQKRIVKNQTIGKKKMNQISGSHQAYPEEDDRLQTAHPSMWTTDQNLGLDCPSHGQTRTLDQDYHLKVDEWTDFTMDRPPHGRIRTMDQENNFEVDHRTDF